MYLGLSYFPDVHALRPYLPGLNCCPHVSTVEEKMGWILEKENFCCLLFMARRTLRNLRKQERSKTVKSRLL